MFFNLIPLPPLDGSRVLPLILPKSAWPFLMQMERYGFTIIFAILFVGPMLSRIGTPELVPRSDRLPAHEAAFGSLVGRWPRSAEDAGEAFQS